MDLNWAVEDGLTLRRFNTLATALPPDSCFQGFIRNRSNRDLVDSTIYGRF